MDSNLLILPGISNDRYITSSIPDYFEKKELPFIYYRYNTPIRNTLFNFSKLVSDLAFHIPLKPALSGQSFLTFFHIFTPD